MSSAPFSPEAALADALAAQLHAWAAREGSDAAAAAAVATATRELAQAMQLGHVCLPLPAAVADVLRRQPVVGSPALPASRPLLLDEQGRLYLHRAFDHERALAARCVQAAALIGSEPSAAALAALDTLFEPGTPQHAAGHALLTRRLVVVSGGPGTGKTTTARQLIALLRVARPGARVALAAPTGKAAARLAQAVAGDGPGLLAATVHRLLGARADGRSFAHDASNPLPLDVLVVDEASMLDLRLARCLFDAVPPQAQVLLLGDKDQLAAVEAGAVFAELARGALPGTAVTFNRSYRFPAGSGIATLAAAFNAGDAAAVVSLAAAPPDATVHALADASIGGARAAAIAGHEAFFTQAAAAPHDAAAAHAAFATFRVLCALREGPLGVEAINAHVVREARARAIHADGHAWCGQPLMVLRNDPLLGLFNGDIGIALPSASGAGLAAWFQRPDGSLREVPIQRLPPHEVAFASTVHKAQGSEFDRVLVLPGTQPSRVLTRELLYTAVTRARHQVQLGGNAALLAQAAQTATVRHSGLATRIEEAVRERQEAAASTA